MSKGAATEKQLGGMHSLLAKVFEATLKKYLRELEVLDTLMETPEEGFDEMFMAALMEIKEPNPAMLSAASKFLKDNDVGLDSEEVEQLSATERRLADSRKRRAEAGVNLSVVPLVEAM